VAPKGPGFSERLSSYGSKYKIVQDRLFGIVGNHVVYSKFQKLTNCSNTSSEEFIDLAFDGNRYVSCKDWKYA